MASGDIPDASLSAIGVLAGGSPCRLSVPEITAIGFCGVSSL